MSAAHPSRPTISLDGLWLFAHASERLANFWPEREIRVPGIWQAQFAELRNTGGVGRYRREVEVPAGWAGKRIVLTLDGVFHRARIRMDGGDIAAHDNPWTPCEIDLTDRLAGRTRFTLEVEAEVPGDRHYREGEWFGELLHGKQDWYGLQGGIWKSVRLEARDPLHIAELTIRGETDLGHHRVWVEGRATAPGGRIAVRLTRDGASAAEGSLPVDGEGRFAGAVPVAEVALWSPESPALYEAEIALEADGETRDALTRTVGFRLLEARDGRLFLNGAPFYMIGALDQDWHPEEECRPPNPAFLEERFRNARALGLNTLRCHVKIPDPLYFDLCDRLGLIVWLDIPYTEFLTANARERVSETFEAAARLNGHHPSIAIWTIMNEGWGIELDDNPGDRAWLKAEFDRLKPLVPTSLLVDNSPCFPRNYHLKTDIEDFHWYNAWPGQNAEFDRHAEEFALRAPWTFSPHGDAGRTGTEPLVCSEFGVWGLPHPRDIMEADGSEPWWFESGHDWNSGCGYPHGIETRFRDGRLARIFGDLDGFVDAAQETQFRALKYQIETLRRQRTISGYVITELNDCQWEANGLMDVRNHPRAFAGKLATLQQPWLVIGRTEATAIRAGARFTVSVELAGAAPPPEGATIAWRFGTESGRLGPEGGALRLTAPATQAIRILPLEMSLVDAAGKMRNANSLELAIVPPLNDAPALFAADAGAERILPATGYPAVAASAAEAEAVLATRLTTPVRELLLAGRRVLLVANDEAALTDPERNLPARDLSNFPKMALTARDGTFWDGRWMGAFAWRRTDGPWAAFPNGPMLDEHWSGLVPRYVLTGFRTSAHDGLVDAAMAVGWLHKLAAFSKRSFLGKGWLTATTFDLSTDVGMANPLAPHLIKALALS